MSNHYKQGTVSKAVWPWQQTVNHRKVHRPSLTYSLVTLSIGLTAAGLFFYFGHTKMAYFVATIGVSIFLCSRFAPGIYRVIEKAFQRLSFYIGQTLTWILLVPSFYICFSFGRLFQKITGQDPMNRQLDRDAESYWQEKEMPKDQEQYRRQF